ncbi:MAG: phosphoribosylformylglycinamidine cyclo-ligase, partial [Bifidobacteriaceae bacterium]|nr:phosphoribosylformylglycinamidine cyclo-ligase [Bifidobacteriaceae bacterium]
ERIAAIVMGIAEGCVRTGTALVGGETAEHPGLLGPDEYDVAGAAVGVVEADAVLGPDRVRPGDAVIGIAASGLHSNGYSLVRAIVARTGWAWDREVAEFGRTLGEEVLEPTALYTRACLDLVARLGSAVHAFAHVTGGGLAANLARVLPEGTDAIVRRDAWEVPPVFPVLRELGGVPWRDAERTWNLGIGMVAVVEAAAAADAVAHLTAAGHPAYVIGQTEAAGPAAGPSGARSAGVAAGASGAEASGARSQGAAVHGARVLREQADGAKDQSTKGQGAKGQGAGAQSTRVQGTRVQGTKGIQGGAVTLEGTYRV